MAEQVDRMQREFAEELRRMAGRIEAGDLRVVNVQLVHGHGDVSGPADANRNHMHNGDDVLRLELLDVEKRKEYEAAQAAAWRGYDASAVSRT